MMKRLSPVKLALFGILASHAAVAAPFCLRSQVIPPQCIYNDAQQCDVAARQQNAVCSANPAEIKLSPGNGRFCVVTSARVSVCAYGDRATCDRDAASQHGTCTDAPSSLRGVGVPDPYSASNGD